MEQFNNSLVSIVVPVYNGSKWLSRCIESIVDQSYSNFELILVNDGSTDSSYDICLNYSRNDKRIILIDKENSGVSDTRNYGIKKANGDYLIFVDCDDYIDSDYIKNLIVLMDDNVDLGITGWKKESEIGVLCDKSIIFEECWDSETCLKMLLSFKGVQGYPISKIFRRSIISKYNILFDERISIFEDLLFCCTYAKHCSCIKVNTNYCDYHYVLYESSSRNSAISAKVFELKNLSEIESLEKISDLLDENIALRKKVHARIALSSAFYINRMFECEFEDKNEIKRLQKKIRRNFIYLLIANEGDFKWKMQAFLCCISPKLEFFVKSR